MSASNLKGWSIGTGVLLAVTAMWLLMLKLEFFSAAVVALLWAAPFLAALAASCFAMTHKILVGTSIAVPAVLLALLSNWIVQLSGAPVDFPGPEGVPALLWMLVLPVILLCFAGGLVGRLVSGARPSGDGSP